jgi:hypothetical protein
MVWPYAASEALTILAAAADHHTAMPLGVHKRYEASGRTPAHNSRIVSYIISCSKSGDATNI